MTQNIQYSYKELSSKIPNQYNFVYYNIPTQSFHIKDGIIQKTFPFSHLYVPQKENIIGNVSRPNIKQQSKYQYRRGL